MQLKHKIKQARRIYEKGGYKIFIASFRDFIARKTKSYKKSMAILLNDNSIEEDGKVGVVLRNSTYDSDTIGLLDQFKRKLDNRDVFIYVDSRDKYYNNNRSIIEQIDSKYEFEMREIGTNNFIDSLLQCNIIICTSRSDIYEYLRTLRDQDRTKVFVPHGILTKSYGNYKTGIIQEAKRKKEFDLERFPGKFDVQSVASDIELFYRSSAEGKHPAAFEKFGYPRFNRAMRLIESDVEEILPKESKNILKDNEYRTNILYAPTRKDYSLSNLFPLKDFDIDKLVEFLRVNDTRMLIRPHKSEEDNISKEYINNDEIVLAGSHFSPSSMEMFPYIDVLITDYSSIYIDYLMFDRPIIFFKDNHKEYMSKRGIAFDYNKYFPGKKVEEFDEFKHYIQKCIKNEGGYVKERRFVKNTFLDDEVPHFLESVIEYHSLETDQ